MKTVYADYIIRNPTEEKLLELITTINEPLFIFTITNTSDSLLYNSFYEFKHNNNTYYFFESNVQKHFVYPALHSTLPDLTNIHTLFISRVLS